MARKAGSVSKRTTVPKGKQRARVGEGVYLKASGKYLATFRDPGGRQHWREFRTKAEAEAGLAATNDDVERRAPSPTS